MWPWWTIVISFVAGMLAMYGVLYAIAKEYGGFFDWLQGKDSAGTKSKK